jgi:putative hydrolase of the HAD superfamily
MNNIVLFDADGVLTLPEEVFSIVYSRSHGLDPEPFEQFFRNDWKPIVTGKADLKESIAANPELWQWQGPVDDLLDYWFKTEDVRNNELIEVIRELRSRGVRCYLATEQEKYRGEYMKTVMFKDLFDGYFVTAELGVSKTDPKFFEMIVESLGVSPSDVTFFDDSQSKVDTASSAGIDGQLFVNVGQVKSYLSNL